MRISLESVHKHKCATMVAVMLAALPASARAQTPPDFSALSGWPPSADNAPVSTVAAAGMVPVPDGSYPIGPRENQTRLSLQAYRIDRTEVTNAAFAEFLNSLKLNVTGSFEVGGMTRRHASEAHHLLLAEGAEGNGRYPIIALDDSQARIVLIEGRFEAAPGYEDHPVAETTWAGARAYCLWRGGDLPTEAQWEAAARGSDGRLYPWGNAPVDASRVFVSGRSGVTAPVGSAPAGASPFGLLDMAGSMAEWTKSLMRPLPYRPDDGREATDLAGERVTRGGDYIYDSEPDRLTAIHRNGFSNAPERGHRHIGFRCAATDQNS